MIVYNIKIFKKSNVFNNPLTFYFLKLVYYLILYLEAICTVHKVRNAEHVKPAHVILVINAQVLAPSICVFKWNWSCLKMFIWKCKQGIIKPFCYTKAHNYMYMNCFDLVHNQTHLTWTCALCSYLNDLALEMYIIECKHIWKFSNKRLEQPALTCTFVQLS